MKRIDKAATGAAGGTPKPEAICESIPMNAKRDRVGDFDGMICIIPDRK